ncbi:MAG: DUF6096 family protein, partial [Eubacteriales bacterium]|nr:DUF6096 family protein [Eubacteriales bacterium]
MENLGGLDNAAEEKAPENKIIDMTEERKKKKPFHHWLVGGRDYLLKLKAGAIVRLENKYRKNMMNILLDDGIPPLAVMLTVIQAAMEPWEHGVSYTDVQKLYDKWEEEENGNQSDLYTDVIIPLMTVSGFFTPKQAEEI